jgi:hypothetical protein
LEPSWPGLGAGLARPGQDGSQTLVCWFSLCFCGCVCLFLVLWFCLGFY